MFLYQLTLEPVDSFVFVYQFGAIPAEVLRNAEFVTLPVQIESRLLSIDIASPVPNWTTMFTSMFIHGGYVHMGGNMLYLWVFGRGIEDRFGHLGFIVLYLVAGVIGVLAHSAVDEASTTPLIGASVLGAYFLLYPFSMVRILLLVWLITVVRIPAILVLGVWAVLQWFNGVAAVGPDVANAEVAYFAHLGGFLFGAAVAMAYQLTRAIPVAASALRSPWILAMNLWSWPSRRKSRRNIRRWSSVSCPACSSNELEYFDPPIGRWRCVRCEVRFY